MDAKIAQLEGGPLDGRTWDVSEYELQAELVDEQGRQVTYLETDRLSPEGLTIWTVEVE
ncbi:hypothetical protein [Leifsonia poae]|uniref:hypothetical protein n=1 Tax=Leifsonia poae TaxID=110933 RepID=UPI003D6644FE